MLNTYSRTSLIAGWLATVAVCVGIAVAAGASLSTSALLLVIGVASIGIVMRLTRAPSLTVAEILHSVDAKDGLR